MKYLKHKSKDEMIELVTCLANEAFALSINSDMVTRYVYPDPVLNEKLERVIELVAEVKKYCRSRIEK